MKVLIVEDRPDDRKLLRYNLEQHSCEVLEASDGEKALEIARKELPDVIISDALMPKMDGFQLLRNIKQDEKLKSIPFIFYSAVYTGYKEAELAISIGAEAFVIKPKEPEEFWKELNDILEEVILKRQKRITAELIKEEEEFLRRYSHIVAIKLEEKVRELEKEIIQRKQIEEELRRSHEMKVLGEIAAGVAHEVRNPLNAILSITDTLSQDLGDKPEYAPYLEHIRKEVDRLSRLMKDLLELGKPVQTTSFQNELLTEVCKSTIDLWNVTELSKRYVLRFISHPNTENVYINTESLRLQQCLLNLIENAAQNSHEGSEIILELLEPKGKRINVRIIDKGLGIPPDNLEHIFKPFFSTRKGGTGLGLCLVKHFIESMGGKIAIWNNDPSPGCTVEITLPIIEYQKL